MFALNLAFVGVYVAQTYPLSAAVQDALWTVELSVAVVFAVEYAVRVAVAENALATVRDPYALADALAILPTFAVFVLPTATVSSVGFLRAVRVVRVLRFYRFTRDAEFFFGTVSDNALRAAKLLVTVLVILFVSAGLFYGAEHAANPDVSTFGDAFYYTVVTLSTVGFGDVLPVTTLGRWVTIAAIIAAIILVPQQASKIVKEWTARETVNVTCPSCGLSAHDPDASHCKACGHVIYHETDGSE
ncbi:MAG: potassium channel family protein [Halarchaeum sp.]